MKVWLQLPVETAKALTAGTHVLVESKELERDRARLELSGLIAGLKLSGAVVRLEDGDIIVNGRVLSSSESRAACLDADHILGGAGAAMSLGDGFLAKGLVQGLTVLVFPDLPKHCNLARWAYA